MTQELTTNQPQQAVDLFLRTQITPNTKSAYGRALNCFVQWLEATGRVLTVDLESACEYRDLVLAAYADSTAALHISAIKAFYRTLKALGVITINVWEVVKAPTPVLDVAKTKAVDVDTVDAIYARAAGNPRDLLLLRLLYEAALRRSEAVSLRKDALENTPDGPAIRITGKGRKTALIGITDDLAEAIRQYALTTSGEYIFVGKCGCISVRQANNICTAYGIGCHQLRHSHATNAIHGGAAIQDVSRTLRHSNINTTMRYFSTAEQVKRSSARMLYNTPNGHKSPYNQANT